MLSGVSIIICGYNSSSRITPTLEALQKQQFTKQPVSWEVILVDNASTDNTKQVAEEVWKRNPVTQLRVIKEEMPGLMNARKRGMENAVFDIVSFIDDDNWVETGWVQKVFGIFAADEKTGACGGRSEPVFENKKPEWFDEYQSSFAVGSQADQTGIINDTKGFLWGAGLSFRRSLWNELHDRGFKNITLGREGKKITAGEDTELCYAIRLLGYNIFYSNELLLKHFMPVNRMNINYLEKMCEGFGKAFARLNCYKVLLDTKTFKLYPWWYEWAVAVKNYLLAKLQLGLEKDPWLHNKLRLKNAYSKGYAEQLWIDKGSIKEIIKDLKEVFKK